MTGRRLLASPRARLASVPYAPARLLLACALSLPALLAAPAAHAYCRTHTCEFDGRQRCEREPVTGCPIGGREARWKDGCISYSVHAEGSAEENISADELATALAQSFEAWSEAACEGGATPPLRASYRGDTSCDSVEYNCDAGDENANIVMFRDDQSDLSNVTIALSTIIANLATGEILDVDIEINSREFDFYLDPAEARSESQDLRLVLNHEVGHLLGLSHTGASGALMRAEYDGNSHLPGEDDVSGICSIFPESLADPVCPAPREDVACVGEDTTCSVVVKRSGGGCTLEVAPGSSPRGLHARWAVVLGLSAFGGAARLRLRLRRSGASRG